MTMPAATYRLQFRNGMDFSSARELVPYLSRLGISHLYASPIFTAATGSTHGYDVVNHNEIDPALGGIESFDRLCNTLRHHGIGLILDIVPNHMAASLENPWWRSVVEWGQQSPYARHFDIDWSRKLTLPILGGSFAEMRDAGELSLILDENAGTLALGYFDNALPLHPASWEPVLSQLAEPSAQRLVELAGSAAPDAADALHEAVRAWATSGAASALKEKLRLASLDRAFIDAVHDQQPWELTHWKEARRSLSYRRFFEVTGLAGVRVEDDGVFDDVHALTLELVRSGIVDGLRVDHVDGLADPGGYLNKLRQSVGGDTYLIVEKILGEDEHLPAGWPVDGTTGYEFIDAMIDLLADGDGTRALSNLCVEATGAEETESIRISAKTQIVSVNFEGELNQVAELIAESIPEANTDRQSIRQALIRLLVAMPVYRTYATEGVANETDGAVLHKSVEDAMAADTAADRGLLETIRDLIAGSHSAANSDAARMARIRFQQLAGPAMAKGVEDTLFYRDHRLLAFNEVGCDPSRPRPSLDRFHDRMIERARRMPHALSATATHDTKRGEDARARLLALSEAPPRWTMAVQRWRDRNRTHVEALAGGPAPEPEVEWMIYQALAGVWQDELSADDEEGLAELRIRFEAYLEKAMREAKLRTSWIDIDAAYENVVRAYAARLLDPANRDFLSDFSALLRPFSHAGWYNSLVQTLVKLAAPGIPDIYQGTEVGDFSLVDPDNRRTVHFEGLDITLQDERPPTGSFALYKQWMIARMLERRRRQPELFGFGDYLPLAARGPGQKHLVAFARRHRSDIAVIVAPRLTLELLDEDGLLAASAWSDTSVDLPDEWAGSTLRDALSGKEIIAAQGLPAHELLDSWPLAAFVGRISA